LHAKLQNCDLVNLRSVYIDHWRQHGLELRSQNIENAKKAMLSGQSVVWTTLGRRSEELIDLCETAKSVGHEIYWAHIFSSRETLIENLSKRDQACLSWINNPTQPISPPALLQDDYTVYLQSALNTEQALFDASIDYSLIVINNDQYKDPILIDYGLDRAGYF
jgi:hypothetical protein